MTSESIRLIQGAKTRTIESELNNGNSALKEHLDPPPVLNQSTESSRSAASIMDCMIGWQ